MKAIKLIPLLFLLIVTSKQNFSIDTVSTKYLPLRVGNVWVYSYSCPGNSGMVRIKITGTQNSNGHIYYIFQQDGNPGQCLGNTFSPFLTQLLPMRIDSINGNLMFYGTSCLWQINEHLLDSLRRKIIFPGPDSINNCNSTVLLDSNQQVIFGVSRKTKTIGPPVGNTGYSRTYAMDIGLSSSWEACIYMYNCTYTLLGCVANNVLYGDTSFPVGINKISSSLPNFYELSQNYPNPFNPKTLIEYKLPSDDFVNLSVYDNLGNKIAELVNEKQQAGTYKTEFDGTNYASGVYYYRLETGTFTDSKKMVLIK